MILGFDVSHHQLNVNFGAAKSAAREFAAIKATDGIGWTDPSFAAYRKAAHAAGLIVGLYHFAEGGNPVNEAAYFCGVVGKLQPGEFLVLDWECAYSGDHVAWAKAWLDAVRQTTGVAPLIYMNQSEVAGHNWTPIASTYGLWLAKYDGNTTQPATAWWGTPAMKQYSDAGSVLGVSGGCDVNVFFGTTQQLLAFGAGSPTPTPEVDVQLTDLIESRIPSDIDPATGKGKMVPVSAMLQNTQVNAFEALATAQQALAAVQNALTALAAIPAQTAQALPAMACQGNPKAVLGALGQAASAAANG